MIPLKNVAVSPLQQIPSGHLLVLQIHGTPILGVRTSPGTGVVLLPHGDLPVYMDYQADPLCVHLGTAGSVRVASIPASFTSSATARTPGNMAVIGKSMCLIAKLQPSHVDFGGERFIDVATGAIVPPTDQCWYVTNWSFGISDEHGGFHELFRRPAAA